MLPVEKTFRTKLIRDLKLLYPGIEIAPMIQVKQGYPDIQLIFKSKYAFLETKRWTNSVKQPNQDYYINKFDKWSFAKFINPANKKEVLDGLARHFYSTKKTS